jgi:hypothetical protein
MLMEHELENAGTDLTTEDEKKITVITTSGAACVPHIGFSAPSQTYFPTLTPRLTLADG